MNYNKADFIASYGISSQLPESDRPELSFSGRSNVGKSSLINKLCSRKTLPACPVRRAKRLPSISIQWTTATLWTCPATATPR